MTACGKFIRNLKIKNRIFLFSGLIVGGLITVFTMIASWVATEIIVEKSISLTKEEMVRIAEYFEEMDSEVTKSLRYLQTSISFQRKLGQENGDIAEAAESYNMQPILRDIANLNMISEIVVYNAEGRAISSSDGTDDLVEGQQLISAELRKKIEEQNHRGYWEDTSAYGIGKNKQISIYYAVSSIYAGSKGGFIEVRMQPSDFLGIYNYIGANRTSEFYVFSESGNLFLPRECNTEYLIIARKKADHLEDNENIYVGTSKKRTYYVDGVYIDKCRLYVTAIVPYSQMMRDVTQIKCIVWSMGALFFLLQLLFAELLSRSVSSPIVRLTKKVEEVGKGDLSIRLNAESKDEIGVLSQNFDIMIERLVKLMDEKVDMQRQTLTLELLALQTQITPHFLYNSLEGLSALCQVGENELAFSMSKALSRFYRGVLSGGRNLISIREELNIARAYLEVQSIRYKDVVSYEIQVDEDIMDMCIVKLTIQPFIENAIYHGLKHVRKKGKIEIVGRQDSDQIVLTVRDNGKGIDHLDELIEKLKNGDGDGDKGFGMRNVEQRIKLFFGNEYGIRIDSMPNEWTQVDIFIPACNYEEKVNDFSTDCR